jgi:hypothetical protein
MSRRFLTLLAIAAVYVAVMLAITHSGTLGTSGTMGPQIAGAADNVERTPTSVPTRHHRSTATPTATAMATATRVAPTVPPPPPPTPTPLGGAGPLVVPPVTGSGPSDGGAPWAVWLAIGIAGVAATTAGVYLRRAAR